MTQKILITGGSGTLGREIIKQWYERDVEITIFSTDVVKHSIIKHYYPNVKSIVGDIRDPITVYNAMSGKDLVIHGAAVKHIPASENNSIDTYQINVEGSVNVCDSAMKLGTPEVVGISTDKACHPANAYGATKYLMEKVFQEYSRLGLPTRFLLVRYGNVLESTASVIEAWKESIERGEPIQVTNPRMTRFWISPKQAVKIIEDAMNVLQSGQIFVPKMKALSIEKLIEYTLPESVRKVEIPLRAGEKIHETLITIDESEFVYEEDNYFIVRPTTDERNAPDFIVQPYTSEHASQLSQEELMELLKNE